MQKQEVITIMNNVLEEEFEISKKEFISDANVRSVLSLDSLDIVDLIVIIEMNFKVKLTKEELQIVSSFDSLYDLIFSKVNA
ncbi:MAG: acyl carrier protein [Candidatus Aphodosoma sp.]